MADAQPGEEVATEGERRHFGATQLAINSSQVAGAQDGKFPAAVGEFQLDHLRSNVALQLFRQRDLYKAPICLRLEVAAPSVATAAATSHAYLGAAQLV